MKKTKGDQTATFTRIHRNQRSLTDYAICDMELLKMSDLTTVSLTPDSDHFPLLCTIILFHLRPGGSPPSPPGPLWEWWRGCSLSSPPTSDHSPRCLTVCLLFVVVDDVMWGGGER